jgi:CheY-like chemotaxis protein
MVVSHMPPYKAILVADDSETDAYILKRAFLTAGIDAQLHFVRDGQEAVDYLAGEGEYEDRHAHPLPRMLLLDLKMPKMDGFDVLRWLQKQPKLKRLPVAVLTSSDIDKDVDRAYDLGANSYVVKPGSMRGYTEIVEPLHRYWTEINHPSSAIVRK